MMIPRLKSRKYVYGVDFSGARDAGTRIWIAQGVIRQEALLIVKLFQVRDLLNSGKDRESGLRALTKFIMKEKESIFGLDFPFGLPLRLVKEKTWQEFVRSFSKNYTSPEEFMRLCKSKAGGKELKRRTDIEAKTPFSPYNLRLYRQTYFGIREVLGPLIQNNAACAFPMQRPSPSKVWIIEICPASTLKMENLNLSYKGRGERHRIARVNILKHIERRCLLEITESALRSTIVNDSGGDALDSVIAAFATFQSLKYGSTPRKDCRHSLEGWVYV